MSARDPRIDPWPGDVVRKRSEPSGDYVYRMVGCVTYPAPIERKPATVEYSGFYGFQCGRVTLEEWRQWAADSEIIHPDDDEPAYDPKFLASMEVDDYGNHKTLPLWVTRGKNHAAIVDLVGHCGHALLGIFKTRGQLRKLIEAMKGE